MSSKCHACKLIASRLFQCGDCKDALYCGQKCADSHWDTHKWVCVQTPLALIEGKKRTLEDDARLSDCTNDRDPITLRKLHKFEPNAIVKLSVYGQIQCFDVEGLVAWTQVNPTNPLTNEPFTAEQLQQITDANVRLVESRAKAFEERTKDRRSRLKIAYARSLEERFPGVPTFQVFLKLSRAHTLVTVPQEKSEMILRYVADWVGVDNPNTFYLVYGIKGWFRSHSTLEEQGFEPNSTIHVVGRFGYIAPWTGVPSFI